MTNGGRRFLLTNLLTKKVRNRNKLISTSFHVIHHTPNFMRYIAIRFHLYPFVCRLKSYHPHQIFYSLKKLLSVNYNTKFTLIFNLQSWGFFKAIFELIKEKLTIAFLLNGLKTEEMPLYPSWRKIFDLEDVGYLPLSTTSRGFCWLR